MTSKRKPITGSHVDTDANPAPRKTPRENKPALKETTQQPPSFDNGEEEGELNKTPDTKPPDQGSRATRNRNRRKLRKIRRENNTTDAVDYAIGESELMDDFEALDHLMSVLLDLEKEKYRESYFQLYDVVGELLLKVYHTNPARYSSPMKSHRNPADRISHQTCPDFSWVKGFGSRTSGDNVPERTTKDEPPSGDTGESETDTSPGGRA